MMYFLRKRPDKTSDGLSTIWRTVSLLGPLNLVLLTLLLTAMWKGHVAADSYVLTESDLKAVGHLVALDKSERYCFGFTAGNSFYVVTCIHCAVSDTMLFQPLWNRHFDTLVKIFQTSPEYDLAIFKNLNAQFKYRVSVGDYNATRKGDTVSALIFRNFDSLHLMQRPIEGIYVTTVNGKFVEYIEIFGVGPEGTSGSPVFNSSGEVIAIVSVGRVDSTLGSLQNVAAAVPLKGIWHYLNTEDFKK